MKLFLARTKENSKVNEIEINEKSTYYSIHIFKYYFPSIIYNMFLNEIEIIYIIIFPVQMNEMDDESTMDNSMTVGEIIEEVGMRQLHLFSLGLKI